METSGTTEKTFRLNFKQNTKKEFFAEWTVRADTIEELKDNNKMVKDVALIELKTLNGG